MDQDRQLKDAIDALIQLRDSKGWALLVQKFEAEAENCLREMANVDPEDPKRIRNLQQEIRCYRTLTSSLDELIGITYADEQLEEDEPLEVTLEDRLEQEEIDG